MKSLSSPSAILQSATDITHSKYCGIGECMNLTEERAKQNVEDLKVRQYDVAVAGGTSTARIVTEHVC